MTKSKGVYFIANDKVFDLAITFLKSFRTYNPEIALCLIPYNEKSTRLFSQQEKFNFIIYQNSELLKECDKISEKFHHRVAGHYRKMAIWEGSFDEFIYIDIDTVILTNIEFAFPLLKEFDIINSLSNVPEDRRWVWKDTICESSLLKPELFSYAANTGFIVSRKNVFSVNEVIRNHLPDALGLKQHMELHCMEQPFLNYLIVTSERKYTSLYQCLDTSIYPQNYAELWGGCKIDKKDVQNYYSFVKGKLRPVFMIHWAGIYQWKKIDYYLFGILSRLGLIRKKWPVRLFMPHRKLWYSYYNLKE